MSLSIYRKIWAKRLAERMINSSWQNNEMMPQTSDHVEAQRHRCHINELLLKLHLLEPQCVISTYARLSAG